MKSDWSLGDLEKKTKETEKFSNKKALKQNSIFFDSELPYGTRTSLFYRLQFLRNTQLVHFVT